MIVTWIKSVFSIIGIDLPTTWYFFGLSININDLILVIFSILFIFFFFEMIIGFKCWLQKLTHI